MWRPDSPIDHTIDQLLLNLDGIILAIISWKCRDISNGLAK